jgi:competence protein ComEA
MPAKPHSQLRGVIALLAILLAILLTRLLLNTQTIPTSTTAPAPNATHLADKIDPNTATRAELAAIPDLGERRAAAIIDFRQKFTTRHPGEKTFQKLFDIEQVPGVGPATAENMQPYLQFPTTQVSISH